MIRTILAAVDGSQRTAHVVATAVEIAEKFDARIMLLRVVALPQEYPAAAANPPDALAGRLTHTIADELAKLAAGNPRVQPLPPLVYEGQPWRAIVDEASKLGVDLIVVGSHGFGGWDRVLGTTAGKVANHADRSVLVVHVRPG
jgi:nucleotide-binding universal stress UspA family protein